MLRKILEKVYVTKKFTQCKTSRSIKADAFEIADNKNVEKLFSKYELFFLNQANSSSDPSQILIQQFCIPRPSLSTFTLAKWNPSSTQSWSCSSSVSLFCPTPFDHNLPQLLDIPNQMPSQLTLSSSYIHINNLWVKHATYKKSEPLRAASLSNWDNTVNNNSIFNTKYAEFGTK